MAFPTSVSSFPDPASTDKLNSPSHSGLHQDVNTDLEAVETKLGTGSSTPASNTFLIGDGSGTSSWSSLTSAQLAARITNETGSGSLVFGTSPTLTTPVIGQIVNTGTLTLPTSTDTLVGRATTDTLTNKTLTTPTIADFTNATHTHANTAGGGQLNGANAISDGTITPAELTSGTGSSWSGQDWTPTWTNLTVTSSTVVAKYIQIGKNVYFRISVVLGGGNTPSGNITFSLPVTAATHAGAGGMNKIADARYLDVGSAVYSGGAMFETTTTASLKVGVASGTYLTDDTAVNATVPFTFGDTDEIVISRGFYEAA